MNERNIYLSVIIPAYNESRRIGRTLVETSEYLKRQPYTYEIIVVDDGSKDTTSEVVTSYKQHIPELILLNGESNKGKGYAVKSGMHAAKGAYRLFMDADGSVHIREIEKFMNFVTVHGADRTKESPGYDVVIGSITHPDAEHVVEHAGWHRRILGNISKLMVRTLIVPGIYDTQRGFKLFTARAAEAIFPRQKIHRFGFDMELLVIAQEQGFAIKELPVPWENPAGSTVKPSDYIKTFREMFEIWGNKVANAYA